MQDLPKNVTNVNTDFVGNMYNKYYHLSLHKERTVDTTLCDNSKVSITHRPFIIKCKHVFHSTLDEKYILDLLVITKV